MTIDLTQKTDLGNGFVLSWQRNAAGNVRAVVKDCTGAISSRGSVQPVSNARISQREAMAEHIESLDAKLAPEREAREEAVRFFGGDPGKFGAGKSDPGAALAAMFGLAGLGADPDDEDEDEGDEE